MPPAKKVNKKSDSNRSGNASNSSKYGNVFARSFNGICNYSQIS